MAKHKDRKKGHADQAPAEKPQAAPYGHREGFIELFTADQHWGDAKAAQRLGFGGGAAGLAAYDLHVRQGLRIAVTKAHLEDPEKPVRLHFVGDLSDGRTMASAEGALAQVALLKEELRQDCPGLRLVIVLYPGNHESCSEMQPWGLERRAMFLEQFDAVSDRAVLKLVLPNGTHQEVLVAHLPYWRMGDGQERYESRGHEPRFEQWRSPDLGLPMIHGHTHSSRRHAVVDRSRGQAILVGGAREEDFAQALPDLSMLCVSRHAWLDVPGSTGVADARSVGEWLVAWQASRTPVPRTAPEGRQPVPEGTLAYPESRKYDWRR